MLVNYFVALSMLPASMQSAVEGTLRVSPHTCIGELQAATCTMDIHVNARSAAAEQLCISIALPKRQYECFNGNRVSVTYQVTLESTTTITLTDQSGVVLAEQKLEVGKLASKNYRVRRRFGWGI
ncbi:DUF3019 domain-containing protein [Pseudoalteromonas sp. T1lg75]|uniref:DUF3019 domain-containing protein n=1 Tax=Pseudoalteromonas sp. T1lg75 TaxID=2077102 RepID=UPI000CF73DB4|nr:DUF3019 domain-containing protein [Pseudoalteromonas sp. T1lg75]